MNKWILIILALVIPSLAHAEPPSVVDVSILSPGQLMHVKREMGPVWILYRTPEMINSVKTTDNLVKDPGSANLSRQPEYARNIYRSIKPEYLVVLGKCANGKEVPFFPIGLPGFQNIFKTHIGFYCNCNAVAYDYSGRVLESHLSKWSENMVVPEHHFLDKSTLVIGSKVESSHNNALQLTFDRVTLLLPQKRATIKRR